MLLAALAVVLVAAGAAGGAAASAPVLAVSEVTQGLDDLVSGGYEPPDVSLAAGPGSVLEVVNLAARTWRTDSGSPAEVTTQPLTAFFGVGPNERLTDPRVLYDASSGRWLVSISDVDAGSVLLAVSRTSDPTAQWSVSSFGAPGCADQPRMGVADGVVVLAADIFASCDSAFSPSLGSELWVVNKAQLLAGTPAPAFATYGPDRAYDSLAPAQSLSATPTEYVVGVDVPVSRVAHLLTVDGIPPAAVRVQAVAALSIPPLVPPPSAEQPAQGSSRRLPTIETNDDRVLDSVWENGELLFSANTGCVPAGDTAVHACGRVVQIATAARTVDWSMNLADPGSDVFFPALRPDASGNVVIVYGESGATVLPELVAVARAPDGELSAPFVVAQSAGVVQGGRYGDYFGAARDPLHPATVWVAGEQGPAAGGAGGWGTAFAAVQVGSAPAGSAPTGAAPAPATPSQRATPPRVRAAAVSGRAGSAVRLAYTALDGGAAVRLRVVVRMRGAVVLDVTTPARTLVRGTAYAVSWRPAKRLRGKLAWCVRPLPAGAGSAQSCSTVTLR